MLAIYQLQAWKLNYIDVRSKVAKSVLEPSRAAESQRESHGEKRRRKGTLND